MVDHNLHEFLSWPCERRRSFLTILERLKKVYTDECEVALQCQPCIDQYFGIRVPANLSSSDSSYSYMSSDSSTIDLMAIASDLSGDTILSFGVLSDSEFPVNESDGSSEYSSAS